MTKVVFRHPQAKPGDPVLLGQESMYLFWIPALRARMTKIVYKNNESSFPSSSGEAWGSSSFRPRKHVFILDSRTACENDGSSYSTSNFFRFFLYVLVALCFVFLNQLLVFEVFLSRYFLKLQTYYQALL